VTLLRPRVEETPVGELDAQALIREARRLRRCRWMVGACVGGLITGTGLGLGLGLSSAKPAFVRNSKVAAPRPARPGSTTIPGLSPKTPTALATGPNGDLYVNDVGRDQILRRLQNGKFQVVAGTGERDFSGDGGPAPLATLDLGGSGGLTVERNGTVYFSDNDRVREVLPDSTIETIAGGGTTPLGGNTVVALDASLGQVGGLALGPEGDLYLALPGGVYRLTSTGMLELVVGGPFNTNDVQSWGANPAVEEDFTPAVSLAFDGAGGLFVAGGDGWGLYERTMNRGAPVHGELSC
jgi:hypothetical protein